MSGEPVIIGIGRTRYTRTTRLSAHALAAQAITAALADAELEPAALDGVVRYDRDALWEYDLPGVMGMRRLTFYNAVPFSPGSAPALVRMASMAIRTGLAEVVVGFHARNGTERIPAVAASLPGPEQFQVPFGVVSRVHEAALIVQRHAQRFGALDRAIATTTVAAYRNAARNPRAVRSKPLPVAEYRRTPYVAEPVRAPDCALPAAGAAAFVMTTAARAAAARRPPVVVRGSMQCGLPSTARHLCEWFDRDAHRDLTTAARDMFRAARRRPRDLDLAYLWNGIGPMAVLALEHYGLCKRGKAARFVHDGGLRTLELNPNGGQLAEADLDGINDLIDAVDRLRAPAARAPRTALVAGSTLEPTSAVLLERA